MFDLEKLGAFYLGKEVDPSSGQLLDSPVLYDARDLTTHAVCVGMTGSGKTGLCIDLLEEAALDNVPALIIDPKGDIANLLLTFPELRPEDFLPWINLDDARRKGLSEEEYASRTAETWRAGLAEWHQEPARIQRLRESAEFAVFTPGSGAGLPLSVFSSLAAPKLDWDLDEEILREMVQGTVSALLGLIGLQADPLKDREHILLSNLVESAWRQGRDLDIPALIGMIQKPPIRKLGVFDIDTVFPEKDRFQLAMSLNNLIAAPGFERWLEGEPMEIPRLLTSSSGKPRHSIFYIAHLSDAERMFFVTLLLQQVIAWMRAQSGTTSLRALLYFDEVFGFFPPVAEPPSKRPLLTLLKQARAFGLGTVLTTQNPVDLDYKGLTNAGTWFIGKLQTDRDKMRVLEGLEGAAASGGGSLDRGKLDRLISSLGSRVFLLHNVHEDGPVLFQTRWAMSYLRGPLTRRQIGQLMKPLKDGGAPQPGPSVSPPDSRFGLAASTAVSPPDSGYGSAADQTRAVPESGPPLLPPDLPQAFLPIAIPAEEAMRRSGQDQAPPVLHYEPMLLGLAAVRFVDRKLGIEEQAQRALLLPSPSGPAGPDWDRAEWLDLDPGALRQESFGPAAYGGLESGVVSSRSMRGLSREFSDHLYRTQALVLQESPALGIVSSPKESPQEFAARCREAARERRDEEVDELSRKYEAKVDRLEDRLRSKQLDLEQERADYEARKREELLSAGESLLGMFLGRRSSRSLTGAARRRRMTGQARGDVQEAAAELAGLQQDLQEMNAEMKQEAEAIARRWEETVQEMRPLRITPRRVDVQIQFFGLGWAPFWQVQVPGSAGPSGPDLIPAYTNPARRP